MLACAHVHLFQDIVIFLWAITFVEAELVYLNRNYKLLAVEFTLHMIVASESVRSVSYSSDRNWHHGSRRKALEIFQGSSQAGFYAHFQGRLDVQEGRICRQARVVRQDRSQGEHADFGTGRFDVRLRLRLRSNMLSLRRADLGLEAWR